MDQLNAHLDLQRTIIGELVRLLDDESKKSLDQTISKAVFGNENPAFAEVADAYLQMIRSPSKP